MLENSLQTYLPYFGQPLSISAYGWLLSWRSTALAKSSKRAIATKRLGASGKSLQPDFFVPQTNFSKIN